MVETRSVARERRKREESLRLVSERLKKACSRWNESIQPLSNRLAAVLVPLFKGKDDVVHVLLTERSMQVSTHKGEVCLPGGKRDEVDENDKATALREAYEELQLSPSDVSSLGCLQPFKSKHGLSVTPVIGIIPSNFTPRPNPEEVASVLCVPLAAFLSDEHHSHTDHGSQGTDFRCHFFQHQSYTIWGLTAEILIEVAKLALERMPMFEQFAPLQTVTLQGVCVNMK